MFFEGGLVGIDVIHRAAVVTKSQNETNFVSVNVKLFFKRAAFENDAICYSHFWVDIWRKNVKNKWKKYCRIWQLRGGGVKTQNFATKTFWPKTININYERDCSDCFEEDIYSERERERERERENNVVIYKKCVTKRLSTKLIKKLNWWCIEFRRSTYPTR